MSFFLIKARTMNDVQNCDSYTNKILEFRQTFSSSLSSSSFPRCFPMSNAFLQMVQIKCTFVRNFLPIKDWSEIRYIFKREVGTVTVQEIRMATLIKFGL
jgi:hypothetical protein